MNEQLLRPEIQEFIIKNTGADTTKLALSKNPFPQTDYVEILNQIQARTKAEKKLTSWFNQENIIYPQKISVEQTSSEVTAEFKSRLVFGETLVDLTGGFGVDDFYFAKKVSEVFHCEMNAGLSQTVRHNFAELEVRNISFFTGDSTEFLKKSTTKADWLYIDPSRRNDVKGKVFLLKDCLPDVPELLDFYFKYSNNILIKTAPLLDISAGLSELHSVKNIHIVAFENEVKELLWELERDYLGEISIKTVNLTKSRETSFSFELNKEYQAFYDFPKRYLYEPNSAIMKSGGFSAVSECYNLAKLHQLSHLYTSDELVGFPGRIFKVGQILPYNSGSMKLLKSTKANISARNFPDTVEQIRKKWKISDGGDQYCFFTTDADNRKIALICTKI